MRNIWLGTALLLVALYGVAPVGAATVSGLPSEARLETNLSGGTVVLVKKNKGKKWKKRHRLRKGLGRQREARRRANAHRHFAPSEHRHHFVVIVPMDPHGIFGTSPWLEPAPILPDREHALAVPPSPVPEDPYRKGPARVLPDEDRSTITGRGAPSSAALSPVTCDEGAGIVSSFGFSDVEPRSCAGATYDFAASRDGRSYRIRMNASDGELVEVRRR